MLECAVQTQLSPNFLCKPQDRLPLSHSFKKHLMLFIVCVILKARKFLLHTHIHTHAHTQNKKKKICLKL